MSLPRSHSQQERLPNSQKIAWGSGAFFENVMANGLNALLMPIFNLGFGINAVWLGWAQFIPRALDALTDPILGYLSDNTRSRWGRRRPWIFAGTIICTLLFVLIWMPSPEWSTTTIFIWFLILSILYYQFFGMFVISYNAMGMELSSDYEERTRIQTYRYIFIMLSTPILGWAYKLCFLPAFTADAPPDAANPEIYGVRYVAIILGALMMISGLMPVLFCRERYFQAAGSRLRLWEAIKITLRNRVFVLFLGIVLFGIAGSFLLPFHTYLVIFYVSDGDKSAAATLIGYSSMVGFASSLAAAPLVAAIANRIGKRPTLVLGQVIGIATSLSSWFLFSPTYPYLFLLLAIPGNIALGTLLILYNSVIADICDLDELKTKQRREGLYAAVGGFATKVVFSSFNIVIGYMLMMTGFQETLPQQSSETILNLRLVIMLFPCVMAAVTLILLFRFPLTRERTIRIQDLLVRRRGELTT